MGAGECSNSKPCEPSASSQAAGGAWAKLVPADSAYPEVEVAEDDAVVCSLVAPAGGEELAWCEIRRGGDASSATIRNLSLDAIIVDGRVIQEEAVDIKPGSEIVPGPQKEGYLVYTFDITAAKDHDKNNIKIALDVENAKCSICLNLWHDVVTVAPCFHNFCNGCFSEWLRRSSTNSRDKSQSAACPQCRTAVQSVGRNHFLHNIEEAILQAFSSLQRSDEEIALLESYASVKSNLMPPRRAVAGRGRGRGPLPPPPPVQPTLAQVMTLAQGMAQQTRLLEAIAASQRTGAASRGSRFGEFMSTKPPIFSSAYEPLEAEDWLRTIEKKLTLSQCREEDKVLFATHQLAGPAADWWDNYLAARVGEEPEVTAATEEVAEDEEAEVQAAVEVTAPEIEWTEFKEAFRSNHIPSSVMRMKRNEFRMLKQGNSSVAEYLTRFNQLARYAQNDIADEGEKIDRFMEGLCDGLQVQLIVQDFHSFQHLVNKTLLLENERKTFEASRKRKMGTSRASTPSHRPFYIAPSSSGAQPTALPRATAPANRPSSASYATPVRPSQPQQVGTALANLVCLKCGGTGYYARNCGQQSMTPVRFNINTPARPPSTPGTAVRGRPLTSSAPRTTSFQGQGRVNHITAEEAQ